MTDVRDNEPSPRKHLRSAFEGTAHLKVHLETGGGGDGRGFDVGCPFLCGLRSVSDWTVRRRLNVILLLLLSVAALTVSQSPVNI